MAKQEILVPDIGDYKNVDVIEIFVKVGDLVQKEASLISLETDKATMEVPSPFAGKVLELKLKVGDKVSKGSVILVVEASGETTAEAPKAAKSPAPEVSKPTPVVKEPIRSERVSKTVEYPDGQDPKAAIYASPLVRKTSREFGVELGKVRGSGRKGRILPEDVQDYVRGALEQKSGQTGTDLGLIPDPLVDFAKFGPIEVNPLPRIKKLSGANLARNWVRIPHITLFDDADISDLETLRKAQKTKAESMGIKLSPLPFIVKAVASSLQKFPLLNSALSSDGQSLITRKYIHIGVAIDTKAGLVIAVVRDADQKGVFEIAKGIGEMAAMAQEGKLKADQMQGGTFTLSSLGSLGTRYFTPIVNMPEVAILGVSKALIQPVWMDSSFVARTFLPLSLSLDHRVVDGAEGAKFLSTVVKTLADLRELIL